MSRDIGDTGPAAGGGSTQHSSFVQLRRVVLVGLLVVGLGALGAVLSAGLDQVSFEPTDASEFQAHVAQALLTGGLIALSGWGVGMAAWLLSRRRRRWLAVAAAAGLFGVGSVAWGAVVRAARAHPEAAMGRALTHLVMPARYTGGGIRLDHPDAVTAPAATRTWSAPLDVTQGCSDVGVALGHWADARSLQGGSVGADRCYWLAQWHGHAVDANVSSASASTTASTTVSTTVSVRLAG